jgi:hypothetical protein
MFLSAFLQFWIEPMFAKMVLPMLGGAPSVWNTCVVFYQATLLAGYVYAHLITKGGKFQWQMIFHLSLLFSVFLVLPIGVAQGKPPPVGENPVLWLFLLLSISIGVPFLVISATTPLLQKWFTFTTHPAAKDPYFLYSASNLGSIIGLLSYPMLIEVYLPLSGQTKAWTLSYLLLAGMIVACAILVLRSLNKINLNPELITPSKDTASNTHVSGELSVRQRARWVLLAFVPSSLLLGVTNYITTDIAQVPLLWIIPLAIYLITFILVFARKPILPHLLMVRAQPFLLIPLGILFYWGFIKIVAWPFIPFHLLAFFVTAMVCHGEIAYSRPPTRHLTEYYLWISIGGILGGIFNTWVAPQVFNSSVEYPLVVVIACLLRPSLDSTNQTPYKGWLDLTLALACLFFFGISKMVLTYFMQRRDSLGILELVVLIFTSCLIGIFCFSFRKRPIRFGLGMGAILLVGFLWTGKQEQILYKERNFFGIHKVVYDPKGGYHLLFHGTTLHGAQSLNPARTHEPLAYYYPTGPLGQVFAVCPKDPDHAQVAVIGLGTGSAAGYAKLGQVWTFYEIDPAVERIARDTRYFTFLKDSPAKVSIVLGDARRSLTIAPDLHYDLIVLDAFSSDAIPIHLLTKEALTLFLTKLQEGGLLVFHISNRYLNLRPVLGNLAHDLNLAGLVQDDMKLSDFEKNAKKAPSTWVVMARRSSDLGQLTVDPRWRPLPERSTTGVWTDDFSNIVRVFKWSLPRIKK